LTFRDHSTEQNHEIVDIARNTTRKTWTAVLSTECFVDMAT